MKDEVLGSFTSLVERCGQLGYPKLVWRVLMTLMTYSVDATYHKKVCGEAPRRLLDSGTPVPGSERFS